MSTSNTRLVLVGGFLGAGKTTLLQQAAVRLAERGHRVALLANDQAANLVHRVLQEPEQRSMKSPAGASVAASTTWCGASID